MAQWAGWCPIRYRSQENRVRLREPSDGIARLTWVTATFNDRGLHRVMGEAVYANVRSWEFYKKTGLSLDS